MKYLGKCFRCMPLVLSIGGPISFLITYGFAVGNNHISAFWPYISDTGTNPPESCVFGLLLNTFGFSLLVVVYLRYRVISELIKMKPSLEISRVLNRLSAAFGYVSCLGLIIVANFEETNQLLIHIIGAVMAFVFGIGYSALQTNFGYKMDPDSKRIFWLRIFLTTFCLLFVIGFLAPIAPAMAEFKGKDFLKWTSKDGGFEFHLMSTFSEWFLMLSYSAFFVTIFLDFRHVRILPPPIEFLLRVKAAKGLKALGKAGKGFPNFPGRGRSRLARKVFLGPKPTARSFNYKENSNNVYFC